MNLTLVLGAAALVAGSISGDGKISSYNFLLIFFLALLPVMFALDGAISRMEGFILLASFCLYLTKLFRDRSYFHKKLSYPSSGALQSVPQAMKQIVLFFMSAALLVGSSFALVSSASDIIGTYVPIGAVLFGALILSIGTTLPELASSIRAAREGRTDAVLGTVLGSVAFNAAAIVGLVALIQPITIRNPANFLIVSLFLMGALVLFHTFVFTHRRLSRTEGGVLLLLYAVFFAVMFAQCAACIAA